MTTASLRITEWVSPTDPLFVRSALIEGATELGLVDTQFTCSNALRLAADLLETGKRLAWVYITHPHLDHFNGAALLRHVFPEAVFYAQPSAINEFAEMVSTRQAALGAGVPGGPANLPTAAPNFVQPLPNSTLMVDGVTVEILGGCGDHPDSSVVWVPSAKTVITGDVVFAKTHAFTGDHRSIPAWINFLLQIEQLEPSIVIVGHGAPTARHDRSIIREQIAWLNDFQTAINEHDALEHVETIMRHKYPDYANDFIFAFSYHTLQTART